MIPIPLREIRSTASCRIILSLIFLFHFANNFIVVRLNNAPLVLDSLEYFNNAEGFFRERNYLDNFRPPLLSFLAFPAFLFAGASPKGAVLWVGGFSLFLLLLSTYLLAKEIHSKETGILSVLLLSNYPLIFGHSRSLTPDLILSACVTFSIFIMLKSDFLTTFKSSLALGIIWGLGMLAKVSCPLYMSAAFILLLVKNIKDNKYLFPKLTIVFLAVLSVAGWWYLNNIGNVFTVYTERRDLRFLMRAAKGGWWGFVDLVLWHHYFHDLLFYGLSIMCVYFPLVLILLLAKVKKITRLSIFAGSIIFPYFVLSLKLIREPRYIIPFLPLVAIIYSLFAVTIQNILFRRYFIILTITASILNTLFISYSRFADWVYPSLNRYVESSYLYFGLLKPWRDDWKLKEIAETIEAASLKVPATISFINTRAVIYDGLYNTMLKDQKYNRLFTNHSLAYEMRRDDFLPSLEESDIVIVTERNFYWYEMDNESERAIMNLFKKNIASFALLKIMMLPDTSVLRIYRNKRCARWLPE